MPRHGAGLFLRGAATAGAVVTDIADEVRDTSWDYIALGHEYVQTNGRQGSVAVYYAEATALNDESGGALVILRPAQRHETRELPRLRIHHFDIWQRHWFKERVERKSERCKDADIVFQWPVNMRRYQLGTTA